ncbi:MAG: LemA family protein [Bacteroidia bacterium]
MNSNNLKTLLVIGVFVLLGMWSCGSYNGLVNEETNVELTWSNVEVQYQNRADKIVEIAQSIKAEGKFEKSTLTEIIDARSSVGQTKLDVNQLTDEKLAQYEKAQQSAFSRMMVVFERYPELKTTESYKQLNDEISEAENRIATARKDYNASIKAYNLKVRRFPGNLMANLFGFERKSSFAAEQGAEKRVDVSEALGEE